MPQKKLKSPIISVKDLCGMLDHFFGVANVTPECFDKPTREFVKRVYSAVLLVCQGITSQELEQPPNSLSDCVDNPQHFHDTMSDLLLSKGMMDFLSQISRLGFSMEDILWPDARIFKDHLYEIMNFMKFRGEQMAFHAERRETRGNLLQVDNAMKEELEKNEKMLAELKAARQVDEDEAKALKPECDSAYQDCQQLQQALTQNQNERGELNMTYNRSKDKLAAATFECNSKMQELEDLRRQIVQSPDRLQGIVEHASKTMEQEEQQLEEMRKESMHLYEAFKAVEKYRRGAVDICSMLKELESLLQNEKKVVSKEVKSLKEKVKDLAKDKESVEHLRAQSQQLNEAAEEKKRVAKEKLQSEQALSDVVLRNRISERDGILKREKEIREKKIAESCRKVEEYRALEELNEKKALKYIEEHFKLYEAMQKDFNAWRDELKATMQNTAENAHRKST
ncbi:hypothetical protein BSKO_02235 [Bryopsis sp. KO-2023]|nr:hypothetical protein BSKO_02235 [Bryopsis sp. KO-2023]